MTIVLVSMFVLDSLCISRVALDSAGRLGSGYAYADEWNQSHRRHNFRAHREHGTFSTARARILFLAASIDRVHLCAMAASAHRVNADRAGRYP